MTVSVKGTLSVLGHWIGFCILCNGFLAVKQAPWLLALFLPAFLALQVTVGRPFGDLPTRRLRIERHGTDCLTVFLWGTLISLGVHGWLLSRLWPEKVWDVLLSAIWCVAAWSVVFWNGMLSVGLTSSQLGLITRLAGFLFGGIPLVHLPILGRILSLCRREIAFESQKVRVNREREAQAVCRTRYPILLVHGVFFRDSKILNYWGRIPDELEKNGATVYYGEHPSAASVPDSAEELTRRIRWIVQESGCEKVNIIAHSKGGLDCRWAIANGAAPYVASLTTVNTPHRGCLYAEHLLKNIPEKAQQKIARAYNAAAKRLGDRNPDFMAAVWDLTAKVCTERDEKLRLPEGIYGRSVGSVLAKSRSGKFPLNVAYPVVKHFDGPNDGLVAVTSFSWGEDFTCVKPTGKRGISHGDMVDMNRENIPGFDVREFYVNLVQDLKRRGL